MKNKKEILGETMAFAETGTEGILWAVQDAEFPNEYKGLNILKDGDYLEVYDEKDQIIWKGFVDLDWKINYTPYPKNPEYGQQCISGLWVHGVQKDLIPEEWLNLFDYRKKYKAKLLLKPE